MAYFFLQQEGADYNEIFALVVETTATSLLLAITNHENWELEEMGVVTIFSYGRLKEEVHIKVMYST